MKDLKIGLELEFQLLEKDGTVSNRAKDILEDEENKGFIVQECSQSMVEVIATPSADLEEVAQNFERETSNLERIAKKKKILLMPSTTVGKDAKPLETASTRYASKKAVLKDKRPLEYHIPGTHIHVDRLPEKQQGKQYQLMTAMDPVFALMSSTPFFNGTNSLHDHRVAIYRNTVFADHPLQGQLLPYLSDLGEIVQRQLETYANWIAEVKKYGFSGDGFTPLNTCWGPIKLAERTFEGRGADANVVSRVIALGALYKGVHEYLKEEYPELVIDAGTHHTSEMFSATEGRLILPSYQQLKKFERIGIEEGISNPELRQYVINILATSMLGLSPRHTHFLEPFKESLRSGQTLSRDIVEFAKARNLYSRNDLPDDAAREIRLYIADSTRRDLEEVRTRFS